VISPRVLFYAILFKSVCFWKNTNPVLKYLIFVKTSKNTKTKLKKKIFLCIRPSVSKLKKIILCLSYTNKKCFSMHFGFNNQFIKVKRILVKISKTTKILFYLSFSIRGTTLHVIRLPDIKFLFSDARTVRFYRIKIITSLLRRAFLEI